MRIKLHLLIYWIVENRGVMLIKFDLTFWYVVFIMQQQF